MFRIESGVDGEVWDEELARLSGHPWQSAAWGDAQRETEGVEDYRLKLSHGGQTVQMVRIETRKVPGLGKLAWIRRGPTGAPNLFDQTRLHPIIGKWLADHGFVFAVANPWCRHFGAPTSTAQSRTIWIDLTIGQEQLWRNLQSHWRSGVNRAQRRGIVVETTRDPEMISRYFALCDEISKFKGFELRMSAALIERLLEAPQSTHTEAQLFIARHEDEIAAGALMYRCGASVHYMGGASNRAFSRQHPGEALHWAVIEWALAKGCMRYDLEGIDPIGNPGTYDFKRKMGGEEVTLASRRLTPINITGHLLAPVARPLLDSRFTNLSVVTQWIRTRSAQEAA